MQKMLTSEPQTLKRNTFTGKKKITEGTKFPKHYQIWMLPPSINELYLPHQTCRGCSLHTRLFGGHLDGPHKHKLR